MDACLTSAIVVQFTEATIYNHQQAYTERYVYVYVCVDGCCFTQYSHTYTHIYFYTYTYTYTYTHTYTYIHTHKPTYTHIYTYTHLYSDVLEAVTRQDVDKVREILTHTHSLLNQMLTSGQTVLHVCVSDGLELSMEVRMCSSSSSSDGEYIHAYTHTHTHTHTHAGSFGVESVYVYG